MPTPMPSDCAVSVCGFIFTREVPVYADWITWAGAAVIVYTLLMLTLVNVRNHQRRERRRLHG